MTAAAHLEFLDAAFAAAPDPGFRGRVLSEYRKIKHWVKDRIDWDTARILDFGCGGGIAAASIALRHPQARVGGFDIVPVDVDGLAHSFDRQAGQTLPPNLSFLSAFSEQDAGETGYDLIYSWSVFEHIRAGQIAPACRAINSSLRPNGLFFLQIDPLYFSPRGSHLYRYFKAPWHHLTLSIDELHEAICTPAHGELGAREWQQFVELNRLTGRQIIERVKAGGLRLLREEFFSTELEPPPHLLDIYQSDSLTTVGLYALFGPEYTGTHHFSGPGASMAGRDNELYWQGRHANLQGSLASVGKIGTPESENRQRYARKKRRVADLLRFLGRLDLSGSTVLDVGCGVGAVSELFYALGAAVSGVDASDIAIAEARDRSAPPHSVGGAFIVGSVVDFNLHEQFDFVFCLDVLYHIMDDNNWLLTLGNLAAHTRPGGYIVIIDQLQDEPSKPAAHVRFRTADMYARAFEDIGALEVASPFPNFLIYQPPRG